MRRARSSPTLGTSSSYVASTLRLLSFVHTFILKAIKKCSLPIALSRVGPNPLVGSEASFLYHMVRVRPDPTIGRAEPPLGDRWWEPPDPQRFFFFDQFLILSQGSFLLFG
jgi:hypothetical protein